MMNYEMACNILNIKETNIQETTIKRQYRMNALKYHPDKNPDKDTTEQFHKIQEAYEYLMKYEGYSDIENTDMEENVNSFTQTTFQTILLSFINDILREDVSPNMKIFRIIINKISTLCEKKAIEYLENVDKSILIKLYEILNKYQESLHYTKTFMQKIREMVQRKNENDECIILNPSMDDMYNEHLYKLSYNNSTFIIPLWHHELVYDISGRELYVKCNPIIDDNIEIDTNNDIYITSYLKMVDIWKKDIINIECGSLIIPVQVKKLNIIHKQRLTLLNKGIPQINTQDIYNISKKSNIYIDIIIQ